MTDARTDKRASKNNPSNPTLSNIKCYRCNKMGYKSNTYPKQWEIRIYKGRNFKVESTSESDSETDEESYPDEGCQLSCLIHRTFHTPRTVDTSQRSNLFHTRGTVHGNVYHIIIDNSSNDNLISKKTAQWLGLSLEQHPKPYIVGWIYNKDTMHVTKFCKVPLGNCMF